MNVDRENSQISFHINNSVTTMFFKKIRYTRANKEKLLFAINKPDSPEICQLWVRKIEVYKTTTANLPYKTISLIEKNMGNYNVCINKDQYFVIERPQLLANTWDEEIKKFGHFSESETIIDYTYNNLCFYGSEMLVF
jgi:hypothetical protein